VIEKRYDPVGSQEEGTEALQMRVYGSPELPPLIYLPGSHGDWSVIAGFRNQVLPHVRFVEFTYPRTQCWTMEEYGRHVADALADKGIKNGWLLGESFGSQIAWQIVDTEGFQCDGIILCGGFVRHPFPWGVAVLRTLCGAILNTPARIAWLMQLYEPWVTAHYEKTDEQYTAIQEFKSRRTVADGWAAIHRLFLIQHHDPRFIARSVEQPVFFLGGFWDPLVPWYLVRPWLKLNCRRYVEGKIIGRADHNVLFSAPKKSAQAVLKWLGRYEKKSA